MHFSVILRIVGILLMIFSMTMVVPGLMSWVTQDSELQGFIAAFLLTFGSGLLLWIFFRGSEGDLNTRDGFIIVSLFWAVLGMFGSLPFVLAPELRLGLASAVFESVSAMTTTGATVISGLDQLPSSILFYRSLLQWLGGIGIIVIAVAILPILGVGGMQLYRAETPGPVKDSKLTPRITGTAKMLFAMYLALTVLCALCYWLAGMTVFDAICHAFTTMSSGGMSTHDDSMAYFQSPTILLICSFFMVLAGINFAVHFSAWSHRSLRHYLRDSETQFYLAVMGLATVALAIYLHYQHVYYFHHSALQSVFHVVSIVTSTGFTTTTLNLWPPAAGILMMLLAFMGGCGGSTAGGMKVVRIMLVVKQGIREMRQLVHPNAVIPLKVGNRRVDAKIVSAVWSFVAVYMFSFLAILMALMVSGLDYVTAFSATSATINNMGPGLGDVAVNYAGLNDFHKGLLSYSMLLGRLEVFTLLVLFTPTFWRH